MADLSFNLVPGHFASAAHVLAFNDRHCCRCKHGGDDGLQCPIFQAGYDSYATRQMPDAITSKGCAKFEPE